jgi:hypothetical protein
MMPDRGIIQRKYIPILTIGNILFVLCRVQGLHQLGIPEKEAIFPRVIPEVADDFIQRGLFA